MPKLFILAACLLFTTHAIGAEIPIKNAGFEEVFVGKRIPGWSRTQHAGVRAYEVSRDTENPGQGKHSIRMLRTTEQAYGLISQVIETNELAGKQIELTAALKTMEVGKLGWVMVMTFMNHSAIVDQVRAAPVTGDTSWNDVVLTKVAPKNTTAIEIGFLLLDGGSGWADNVRLRTVEGTKSAAENADPGKRGVGKSGTGEAEAVAPKSDAQNR